MRVFRLSLAVSALAVSLACGGSPSGPSEVTAPAASAGSGSRVTSQTLEGRIRTKPAPNAGGVIVLDAGEKLIVNANDELAANPGPNLHLIVNWGDGPNERIGCGACRLEHAYRTGGLYEMEATVDDGVATASRRFRVEVRGSLSLFDAEPRLIPPGGSTNLVWNVGDATSVSIDNGIGAVSARDAAVVSPAVTTTYTLRASGPSGTETLRVTVVVSWIKGFFFDPTTIGVGGTSNLTLAFFPGFTSGFIDPTGCPGAAPTDTLPHPDGLILVVTGFDPGPCQVTLILDGGGVTSTETATLVVQ
jgi:hypothetical protein